MYWMNKSFKCVFIYYEVKSIFYSVLGINKFEKLGLFYRIIYIYIRYI